VGSGETCGAIFLHQGFLQLLCDKLGWHAKKILTQDRQNDALTWFENVKYAFNPYDKEDTQRDYRVPLNNAPNIRSSKLLGGYLKLSRYENINALTFD